MGVDNNGILFLGRETTEVDLTLLPEYDYECIEEVGLGDFLWAVGAKSRTKRTDWLASQPVSNSYPDIELIGFELANSGSYDCKEVNGLIEAIAAKTKLFLQCFGVEPKIYIMNYQW